MADCPHCTFSENNVHRLRQHRHEEHGEFTPNRICKGCASPFYDAKSQRSFCQDCNPNAGKHNGNWQDAKERATCRKCTAEFEYYPSDKKGIFCSQCIAKANGGIPELPSRRVDRCQISCGNCDTTIEILPSVLKKKKYGTFCDRDCYGEWLSEKVVGENHHQWEGGSISYGSSWWKIRRKALQRDKYTCQICNIHKDELGRNPDVHHIVPVREYQSPSDAHQLENVICLCRPCHRLVESGQVELPQ